MRCMSTLITTLQSHYSLIKSLHIGLVACSGGLFLARGLGVQLRATWPMRAGVRRLSVWIDVCLLVAGASLWTLLGLNPVRDHWLAAKLGLLLAYIVLGSFALKRGRSQRQRALAFVLALGVFGFMVGVVRAHHALGPFAAAAPESFSRAS